MIDLTLCRAQQAGVALSRAQAEKLVQYHEMLVQANRRFNLTRVSEDYAEALDRNYIDCILPLKIGLPENTRSVIDVGSGAGFPGIPLSICRPDVHFVLMDSLGKRVEFLKSVIDALQLNAEAVHMRAEDGARKAEYREQFDVATARAVAALNLLSEYLLPFVRQGGYMMALKGPTLQEELLQAENALKLLGGRFVREDALTIPDRDWDHRVAWIEKCAPTPDKYPRKAGKPEKKPL